MGSNFLRLLVVVGIATLVSPFAGAQKIMTMNLPDHPPPPFPFQLRKMVEFVQLACMDAKAKKPITASGTGFFVAYHDPHLPEGQYFHYFVTNRHVAECWDEKNQPRPVQSVAVRVNLTNGSSTLSALSQQGSIHWYFPTDESIDLAVTPAQPDRGVDNLQIPLDMFATKEFFAPNYVGEGSRIILSGFFYQFPGVRRLQPIIREGILSMMPDEPIQTATGKMGMVYLGEVHVFGGNSGSPVFINIAGVRPTGVIQLDEYRFLGVVSGYYFEDSDLKLQVATTAEGKLRANSGVSMIVPADFLKDLILNDPGLKAIRDSELANLKK